MRKYVEYLEEWYKLRSSLIAQQHVFWRKIKTAQRRKELTQEDVSTFFGVDFSRQPAFYK
ncbi:hypothetical protein Desor_1921 [Desulfosporosinus orientis DSM 765]|uniref:Uncharacterized protein n=1 Tax=Desulfosporosinus orientis (strain ATCC 19365 / DSM 765 / NCIMB 8382 / VKM B-1628 / Singapore I) TaxID=768706 RepID=G7WD61_DESOD|nr:hypothetical protein Desor_1921 [Desulfosporosinus orientis DSM 765]